MTAPDQPLYTPEILRPDSLVPAHPEDSLAPAEHVSPAALRLRLSEIGNSQKPGSCLARAWIYNELAMATPDTSKDEMYFSASRRELATIRALGLPLRSSVRLGGEILGAYEETFMTRAAFQPRTRDMDLRLQVRCGELMLDYIGEDELSTTELGRLSELIVPPYLIEAGMFPYPGSQREEANMRAEDNHDYYTLGRCADNGVKKAPISVKYWTPPESAEVVVPLIVGQEAIEVAKWLPPFRDDERMAEVGLHPEGTKRGAAFATRLAADIMVCRTLGEDLSLEDTAFMSSLALRMRARIQAFMDESNGVDYAANATVLTQELHERAVRIAQARGWTHANRD